MGGARCQRQRDRARAISAPTTTRRCRTTSRFEQILARIPAGRWGDADDLAGAFVFLARRPPTTCTEYLFPSTADGSADDRRSPRAGRSGVAETPRQPGSCRSSPWRSRRSLAISARRCSTEESRASRSHFGRARRPRRSERRRASRVSSSVPERCFRSSNSRPRSKAGAAFAVAPGDRLRVVIGLRAGSACRSSPASRRRPRSAGPCCSAGRPSRSSRPRPSAARRSSCHLGDVSRGAIHPDRRDHSRHLASVSRASLRARLWRHLDLRRNC